MTKTYRTTKIQWTEHTWNPMAGCSPVSEGCANCYAKRIMAHRFGDPTFKPAMRMDRVTQPLHWRKPRMVFVCSMGDLFHDDIPDDFLIEVFATMWKTRQHTYQVLTKRPERMRHVMNSFVGQLGGWPSNIWLGVSVENQKQADIRIPILLTTKCHVKFISAEPLLERIDIWQYLGGIRNPIGSKFMEHGLDWVIAGGETGPGARECREVWMHGLLDQCQMADVPFFFKAHGRKWVPGIQNFGEGPRSVEWGKKWMEFREWPQQATP